MKSQMTRIAIGLTFATLVLLGAAATTRADYLANGDTLMFNEILYSDNASWNLQHSCTGNGCVVRVNHTGCGLGATFWTTQYDWWCSGHQYQALYTGSNQNWLAMQTDGNLVLVDGSTPIWHTATDGWGSLVNLHLQDDGNLVLVWNFTTPIWSIY